MEVELEEYVRTKNGLIGILISQELSYPEPSEWILNVNGKEIVIVECTDFPAKHSTNLVDLIEAGDVVELELSEEFVEREDKIVFTRIGKVYTKELLQRDIDNGIVNRIQSILTHEQYNQNCYKIQE